MSDGTIMQRGSDEVGPGFPLPPFLQDNIKKTSEVRLSLPDHPDLEEGSAPVIVIKSSADMHELFITAHTEGAPRNADEYNAIIKLYDSQS